KDIDWQIWIENGPQLTPCKLMITYKNQPSQPQFTAVSRIGTSRRVSPSRYSHRNYRRAPRKTRSRRSRPPSSFGRTPMSRQFLSGKRLASGLLAGTAIAACLAIGAERVVAFGFRGGGGVHGGGGFGGFHGGGFSGFHGGSFAG